MSVILPGCFDFFLRHHWVIGERSDAVLRTAIPGNDNTESCHSGRAIARAGIHNHRRCRRISDTPGLWIPGSRLRRAPE